MKVGDYVRTELKAIDIQLISKIKKICDEDLVLTTNGYWDKEMIIKSSPNIIELFEEHDLVVMEYFSLRYNERVTRLFEVDYKDKRFMTLKNSYADFMLENNEFNDNDKALHPIIKSIVTHEQFERMQYNLESEVN